MNRLEELTLKLADDELSDAEFDELRAAVESDPSEADAFCGLLRLESALRGERETDLARPTMLRLEERLSERVEHRVMDAVWAIDAARNQAGEQSPRGSWTTGRRRMIALLGAAAAVLVAVGAFQFFLSPEHGDPSVADLPQVVKAAGEASVTTGDGSGDSASVGRAILPGETLKVMGQDAEVTLRYSDGTEIGLTGAGELAVERASREGKRLRLVSGLLHANVAKQPTARPLVIVTPHAVVRVLGTRFDLSADKEMGTRLDLESGRVELVRGTESPLTIEPNQIALVPVAPDPIQVLPRPTVLGSPRREMKLRDVSSFEYAADGKTIVGFGDFHAVYWYEDDRLEAAPVISERVGKLRFQGQSGSFIAFEELARDRLTIWNTLDRAPAHVFEDFARLPRFFTQSRDRKNKYVLPGRKTAISPQGDWAALEYYGGGFLVWHCDRDEWRDLEYKGRASAIATSPDGRLLALGHWKNGTIDFFDTRERKHVAKWPAPVGRSAAVSALCFSTDGKQLLVASRGEVRILDAATGDSLQS
ncbi:MAG: FecR domain-containing protein, partial [Planctomycetales bacterium]